MNIEEIKVKHEKITILLDKINKKYNRVRLLNKIIKYTIKLTRIIDNDKKCEKCGKNGIYINEMNKKIYCWLHGLELCKKIDILKI
jgi:hypothetical protein